MRAVSASKRYGASDALLRHALEAGETAQADIVNVGIIFDDLGTPGARQQDDPRLRQRQAQGVQSRGQEEHIAQVVGADQQH